MLQQVLNMVARVKLIFEIVLKRRLIHSIIQTKSKRTQTIQKY